MANRERAKELFQMIDDADLEGGALRFFLDQHLTFADLRIMASYRLLFIPRWRCPKIELAGRVYASIYESRAEKRRRDLFFDPKSRTRTLPHFTAFTDD